MNDEPKRQAEAPATDSSIDELTAGITDLVSATLGVGAALAKTMAAASARATSRPLEPAESASPINRMVHYGFATATNMFGAVAGGAGELTNVVTLGRSATADATASSSPAQPASIPVAHCGSTLRIPLSIQNPSDSEMADMRFSCLEVTGAQVDAGDPLTPEAFAFQPDVLTVQPTDFEKLTVFIEIPEVAAPGNYQAKIGSGEGGFEITLRFDVLPPE
jgi:hypothetical protein